jgi:hypothetical protein
MFNEYQSCIEACSQCEIACEQCATGCMKEPNANEMIACIRLDLECAAICRAAVQIMNLESNHANSVCQVCADICIACAEECEKHEHEHCRHCAKMCRECAAECLSMVAA